MTSHLRYHAILQWLVAAEHAEEAGRAFCWLSERVAGDEDDFGD